jgi:hypothetical protein
MKPNHWLVMHEAELVKMLRPRPTDALHTCKKQAQQILAGGGDYLFVVKGNQRTLYDDISLDRALRCGPPGLKTPHS